MTGGLKGLRSSSGIAPMNRSLSSPCCGRRFPVMKSSFTAILAACCLGAPVALAESPDRAASRGMDHFESTGASRVAEKVRSASTGVILEIHVKVGDSVNKGQVLGHTELDATKLQLDLARHTLQDKSNLEAMQGQAAAWTVTREETEDAVHRRKLEKSRLDWALGMEKLFRGTYEAQLEAKKAQQIQYDYWKNQYEKRFFRAPVDGVISEVLVEVGQPVNYATHVFTIRNDDTFALLVTVPALLAEGGVAQGRLVVRSADGKTMSNAVVDSVTDDPAAAGRKIIKLLVQAADFPPATRAILPGMKFDVLMPM